MVTVATFYQYQIKNNKVVNSDMLPITSTIQKFADVYTKSQLLKHV